MLFLTSNASGGFLEKNSDRNGRAAHISDEIAAQDTTHQNPTAFVTEPSKLVPSSRRLRSKLKTLVTNDSESTPLTESLTSDILTDSEQTEQLNSEVERRSGSRNGKRLFPSRRNSNAEKTSGPSADAFQEASEIFPQVVFPGPSSPRRRTRFGGTLSRRFQTNDDEFHNIQTNDDEFHNIRTNDKEFHSIQTNDDEFHSIRTNDDEFHNELSSHHPSSSIGRDNLALSTLDRERVAQHFEEEVGDVKAESIVDHRQRIQGTLIIHL